MLVYKLEMSLFAMMITQCRQQITDKLMQIDNQSLILGGCNTFLKVKFYFNIYIVVLLYSQEIFSKGVKYPNRKGGGRIDRPFWKLLF